mgnify:FL=1
MRENRIKINKKYFKGNEKYIIVDLTYETEDEKIIKEKFNILDRCMNNLSYNTSIHEAVSIIRTIFKDYKEIDLKLTCVNKNKINSLVKYKNNKLIKYSSTKELENNSEITFDYYYSSGINSKFNGSIDLLEKNKTSEYFNSELTLLKILNNNSINFIQRLSYEELYIVKLYETMYNKKIDFNIENMPNILNSSLFLLQESGVVLPGNIYFTKTNSKLYSIELNNYISKLMLFENIDTSKYNLPNSNNELIKSIGNLVKNHEKDVPKIASKIYDEKYRNSPRNNDLLEEQIKRLVK